MSEIDDRMQVLGWYPVRESTRRNPSNIDLETLETAVGGRLPEDYRRFVARYGQGALRHGSWFGISEPCPWGQSAMVDEFFGFSSEPGAGLGAFPSSFGNSVPEGMVPVATDPMGNLVLLSIDAARRPGIWFWDHEGRARLLPSPRAERDQTYLVADSFSTFVRHLGPR